MSPTPSGHRKPHVHRNTSIPSFASAVKVLKIGRGDKKQFHAKMKVNTCTVSVIGWSTEEEEVEEEKEGGRIKKKG